MIAALHESGRGTFRTWLDVRLESVVRTEADLRRPIQVYGFTPQVLAAVKLLTPVQALLGTLPQRSSGLPQGLTWHRRVPMPAARAVAAAGQGLRAQGQTNVCEQGTHQARLKPC